MSDNQTNIKNLDRDAEARFCALQGGDDPALRDVTELAATLCGVSRAVLAFADAEAVRFVAGVGLEAREAPRAGNDAFLADAVRVVADAVEGDGETVPPALGAVRFYASAPLKTSRGLIVGALVAADPAPRTLEPRQMEGLAALARHAMRLLERCDGRSTASTCREREKLAVAGRMAARVAHEINNPLAGIKNAFLLLKDAIPETHKYARYVPRIEQEIARIAAIVRQMFELYQPEPEVPREGYAEQVLREVLDLLAEASREQGVRLELDSDGSLRARVPEGPFRQIVYNLVRNALDVSPAGSAVVVRARVADGVLTCSVCDRGMGIPEEIRGHVFEPFFTTKTGRSGSGLGLGLPVCKGLAEGLGGTLEFRSGTGEGTAFVLSLPLRQPRGER